MFLLKYKRSFMYRSATLWNKLPDNIKELEYDAFKSKLSQNPNILENIIIYKLYLNIHFSFQDFNFILVILVRPCYC